MKKNLLLFFSCILIFLILNYKREMGQEEEERLENLVDYSAIPEELPPATSLKMTPTPTIVSTPKPTPSQRLIQNMRNLLPDNLKKTPTDEVPMNDKGELVITDIFVDDDNNVFTHGDVLIGHVSDFDPKTFGSRPLILPKPKPWPGGIIPYQIDPDLISPDRVYRAIKSLSEATHIKFVPKDSKTQDFVYFTKGETNCYSNLGRIGGQQKIVLSDACEVAQITHELMHTIGFLHEQNREDRDDYLLIHWEKIEKKHHLQFKKIKNSYLDLKKYSFDFDSIMLYHPKAFVQYIEDYSMTKLNGEPYASPRGQLSPIDIQKINDLYPLKENP